MSGTWGTLELFLWEIYGFGYGKWENYHGYKIGKISSSPSGNDCKIRL